MMQATEFPNGLNAVGYGMADVAALADGAFPQRRVLSNSPRAVDIGELRALFTGSDVLLVRMCFKSCFAGFIVLSRTQRYNIRQMSKGGTVNKTVCQCSLRWSWPVARATAGSRRPSVGCRTSS